MRRKGLSLVEVLVILAFIGILAAILLPVTLEDGPPVRRSACVNNLKQLGLILTMYANENGGKYPPIDSVTNNFMFEGDVLYPEYLSDAVILACPSDPEFDPNTNFRLLSNKPDGTRAGQIHPDCFTNMSYAYLGWMLTDEKEAQAFFDTYDLLPAAARDNDLIVPEGKGNAGTDTIHRLSSDVDQFLNTDNDTSLVGEDATTASIIPIMWDQVSTDIMEFSHVPPGQNVLYLDGHVEFHRYDLNSTQFPVSPTAAAQFGGRSRAPIPDCEE